MRARDGRRDCGTPPDGCKRSSGDPAVRHRDLNRLARRGVNLMIFSITEMAEYIISVNTQDACLSKPTHTDYSSN
jgi:hypothetical protein